MTIIRNLFQWILLARMEPCGRMFTILLSTRPHIKEPQGEISAK